jgi:hypothetical protein
MSNMACTACNVVSGQGIRFDNWGTRVRVFVRQHGIIRAFGGRICVNGVHITYLRGLSTSHTLEGLAISYEGWLSSNASAFTVLIPPFRAFTVLICLTCNATSHDGPCHRYPTLTIALSLNN